MSEPKEIDIEKILPDGTRIVQAHREHRWHMGHRVFNHESKCKYLHGHEYAATFYCEAPKLDNLGRVVDFGVMKQRICNWIDVNWDHRFMVDDTDPIKEHLLKADPEIVIVPYNPTAENIALDLLQNICPRLFADTDLLVTKVMVMETSKCGVTVEKVT